MDKLESMVNRLTTIASKSTMGIKLAAGLFYSKKGFVGVGYNSTRTYSNKTIKSSIHAEDAVIQYIKSRFGRIKTKNLKLIVIRVGNSSEKLLMSKPCLNCTKTISDYGIKKVYYINEQNELICETISSIQSFHNKYPYFTMTDVWFHTVHITNSAVLPIIKKCNEAEKEPYCAKVFAQKILEIREKNNMSQYELALKLCVTKQQVLDMEMGHFSYNGKLISKIRKCFGAYGW